MSVRSLIALPTLVAAGLLVGSAPAGATAGTAAASPVAPKPPASSRVFTPPADSPTIMSHECWSREGRWWCNNRTPAPVYEAGTTNVVDYVLTNPSVFVCRAEGNRNNNGPHPNRWVWTQGDETGRWGYVKDSWISSETDSLPVC